MHRDRGGVITHRLLLLGIMFLGPVGFALGFLAFQALVPAGFFARKQFRLGSLATGSLFAAVGIHSAWGWRQVDVGFGETMLDLPFALASFSILTGLAITPFRIIRLRQRTQERATETS